MHLRKLWGFQQRSRPACRLVWPGRLLSSDPIFFRFQRTNPHRRRTLVPYASCRPAWDPWARWSTTSDLHDWDRLCIRRRAVVRQRCLGGRIKSGGPSQRPPVRYRPRRQWRHCGCEFYRNPVPPCSHRQGSPNRLARVQQSSFARCLLQ